MLRVTERRRRLVVLLTLNFDDRVVESWEGIGERIVIVIVRFYV